jgi:hypothetical protein
MTGLVQVGAGSSDDAGGISQTTRSVTRVAGNAGDFEIVSVYYYEDSNNAVMDTPAGFTDQGATVYADSGSQESRVHTFTRECDGSESAGAMSISRSAQFFGTAQYMRLRGDDTLSLAQYLAGTPVSSATTVDAPTVTLSDTQGLVSIFALSDPPGASYTGPSGMTLGASESTESSNTGRMYFESPASGATGVRTLSWSGGSNRAAIGISLRIEGANVSGGGGGTVTTKTAESTFAATDSTLLARYLNREHLSGVVFTEGDVIRSTIFELLLTSEATLSDAFSLFLQRNRDATDTTDIVDALTLFMLRNRLHDDGAVVTDQVISVVVDGNVRIVTAVADSLVVLSEEASWWYMLERLHASDSTLADQTSQTFLRDRTAESNIDPTEELLRLFNLTRVSEDSFSIVDSIVSLLVSVAVNDGARIRIGHDAPLILIGHDQQIVIGVEQRIVIGGYLV